MNTIYCQVMLMVAATSAASGTLARLKFPYMSSLVTAGQTAAWCIVFELVASVVIEVLQLQSRAPDLRQRLRLYGAVLVAATLFAL